ncbi:MAG: hypothetical protein EA412_09095 [Chitinophagaceae bacterium]|nr:MAG: hypothetical protein EA412_09095 [Chitinophagaceae bacterium]
MKNTIALIPLFFLMISCTDTDIKTDKSIYITDEGDTLHLKNPDATVYAHEIDGETKYFEAVGEPEQTKKIVDGDTIWIFDFKERHNHY